MDKYLGFFLKNKTKFKRIKWVYRWLERHNKNLYTCIVKWLKRHNKNPYIIVRWLKRHHNQVTKNMKTKFYRQVTTTPQLRSIDRWPKRHIIYWMSWNFSIKKSLGSPRPNLFFSDIESRSKMFGLRKRNGLSPIFVT